MTVTTTTIRDFNVDDDDDDDNNGFGVALYTLSLMKKCF